MFHMRWMPALVLALAILTPGVALGADGEKAVVEVRMFNVHPDDPAQTMVFSPRVLWVQPGTTVRFVAVDPSHNTVSTPGMLPEGAAPWSGPFGKPFEVTVTLPGVYGYHCLAHRGMGMVGLIVVDGGEGAPNLKQAKAVKQTGGAAAAWAEIWGELGAEEGKAQGGVEASGDKD